jgi:hypothetical protein
MVTVVTASIIGVILVYLLVAIVVNAVAADFVRAGMRVEALFGVGVVAIAVTRRIPVIVLVLTLATRQSPRLIFFISLTRLPKATGERPFSNFNARLPGLGFRYWSRANYGRGTGVITGGGNGVAFNNVPAAAG